jgi:hypothetical protein
MRVWWLVPLALCACATAPKGWVRPDGAPVDAGQFTLAETACKGEIEKEASKAQSPIVALSMYAQDNPIWLGCMAQHGYLVAR